MITDKTPKELTLALFDCLKQQKVDYAEAKKFLTDGADLTVRDENSNSILHVASDKGHFLQVVLLLECYPELTNLQNKYGATALMMAGTSAQIVDAFLTFNADLELTNTTGQTALHMLAFARNYDGMKMLLEKSKTTINVRNSDHLTPLMYSVLINDDDGIDILLEHGANPLLGNEVGQTPRDYLLLSTRTKPAEIARRELTLQKLKDAEEAHKQDVLDSMIKPQTVTASPKPLIRRRPAP